MLRLLAGNSLGVEAIWRHKSPSLIVAPVPVTLLSMSSPSMGLRGKDSGQNNDEPLVQRACSYEVTRPGGMWSRVVGRRVTGKSAPRGATV